MTLLHIPYERSCLRQVFDPTPPSLPLPLSSTTYSSSISAINSHYSPHLILYPLILLTLTLSALGPILVGAGLHQAEVTGHNSIGLDMEVGVAMGVVGLLLSVGLMWVVGKLKRRLLMEGVQMANRSLEDDRTAVRWRLVMDGVMVGDGSEEKRDTAWMSHVKRWDEHSATLRRVWKRPHQLHGHHLLLDLGSSPLLLPHSSSIDVTQLPVILDINAVLYPPDWCRHCHTDSPLHHLRHLTPGVMPANERPFLALTVRPERGQCTTCAPPCEISPPCAVQPSAQSTPALDSSRSSSAPPSPSTPPPASAE